MLRIAKIYSWFLVAAYLLLLLVSAGRGFSVYSLGALLLLLPIVLALSVFYSRPPRWLAWSAIFLNAVAICLGLYMVGDAFPDLLGLKSSPDARSAAIYLGLALFMFVIPCGLNAVALYGVVTRPKLPPNEAAA